MSMRRFFWWVADLFYFPGWTIHPVLLIVLLLAGAATGLYFLIGL